MISPADIGARVNEPKTSMAKPYGVRRLDAVLHIMAVASGVEPPYSEAYSGGYEKATLRGILDIEAQLTLRGDYVETRLISYSFDWAPARCWRPRPCAEAFG